MGRHCAPRAQRWPANRLLGHTGIMHSDGEAWLLGALTPLSIPSLAGTWRPSQTSSRSCKSLCQNRYYANSWLLARGQESKCFSAYPTGQRVALADSQNCKTILCQGLHSAKHLHLAYCTHAWLPWLSGKESLVIVSDQIQYTAQGLPRALTLSSTTGSSATTLSARSP